MSQQQMDYDETNRQRQETSYDHYEAGYKDPFVGSYGAQKIPPQPLSYIRSGASAGQRLALAIVSLAILIPISGIVFGVASGEGPFGLVGALIGLGLICLTIMVVNIAFAFTRK